jgi:hypothetical protein
MKEIMLSKSRFFQKRKHICLSYLKIPTVEHNNVLKHQWDLVSGSSCRVDFPSNSFSFGTQQDQNAQAGIVYTDLEVLIKHYKNSRSSSVFLQSTYSEHYPAWFLEASDECNFAFAGYGISLSNYVDGQFRTPLIQSSKYLLASSNYDIKGYKENLSTNSQIVLTGNPLMYEIRKSLDIQNTADRPVGLRLLWAPHWSKFWLEGRKGFARWQITLEPILEFARNHPDIEVVVRPHPILEEALISQLKQTSKEVNRESQVSIDVEFDSLYLLQFQNLLSLKNVSLSHSSLKEDVLNSSHLVTDGVSIIAYWATTGKPILIVNDSESPLFNEDGIRLMKEIEVASNPQEILTWLKLVAFKANNRIQNSLVDLSKSLHPTFKESPAAIFMSALK